MKAIPQDKRLQIAADYIAGLKVGEISTKYGINRTTVPAVVQMMGVPLRRSTLIERTGKMFGKLLVVARDSDNTSSWICLCDCGVRCTVHGQNLRRGLQVSCGCWRRERNTVHGHAIGGRSSPTYLSWVAMIGRCEDPGNRAWKYYGARGISVCESWHKFENFLADMGIRPARKTIDRYPNKNGNYELTNCRWATAKEQYANRRTAIEMQESST